MVIGQAMSFVFARVLPRVLAAVEVEVIECSVELWSSRLILFHVLGTGNDEVEGAERWHPSRYARSSQLCCHLCSVDALLVLTHRAP